MNYTSSFIVAALRETWYSLDGYASQLTQEQWDAPSDCPGWVVKDLVSHLAGTERQLLGDTILPLEEESIGEHVKNDMGRMNEAWVQAMRVLDGPGVLAEFEDAINLRLETLDAMSEDDFGAESWMPVGKGTYRDLMMIRVMDSFVHEQDVRLSTGGPFLSHQKAGKIALDQLCSGLPYVVGKRLKPAEGTIVRVDVRSPKDLMSSSRVQVLAGRGVLMPAAEVAVDDAILTCSFEAFVMATSGRLGAAAYLEDGSVEVAGDKDLALELYRDLAFVI